MENKETVLETIQKGLPYTLLNDVLVKPLDIIKVKRDIQKPKPTGEKDKDGAEIYDGTEIVQEEYESIFREGIVLTIPPGYDAKYKEGDTVVFNGRAAAYFDLFKDSMAVKPYDIVAVKRDKNEKK